MCFCRKNNSIVDIRWRVAQRAIPPACGGFAPASFRTNADRAYPEEAFTKVGLANRFVTLLSL
jgi:hypothetical protein